MGTWDITLSALQILAIWLPAAEYAWLFSAMPRPRFVALILSRIPVDVGFLATFFAEFRAYAVWENKLKVLTTISIIAFMTPITICFQEMTSSVSGECWIPGVVEHLDTMASSRWTVVYSLLIVAEFEILLILVYRAVKSCGWRIENRLMRDLIQDNLLYFCCGFVFSICVILTMRFLAFPVAHLVLEFQVIAQTILVTRMHRDFWKSDRSSCGTYGQSTSLPTFIAGVPDHM
ncbi:hypothetical protein AZE42_09589 [Rhizopogon vesiculosus]|uniref:Uncharacterized protein n=1 Tax=Rhizopogon vesiculosus TaxID=180088 RepID=A0A1J8Q8N0_9AGAM|nr:hypothetical protein AZE42_09589 [Rhizopogon vesiculosus]